MQHDVIKGVWNACKLSLLVNLVYKVGLGSLKSLRAREMLRNEEIIGEIRDMGFKRLKLRKGKEEWDVDLKN